MTPTASTRPARPGTDARPADPTHGCARCGDPVPPGIGLCERCNPLGLRDVAASQVHGTVIITVLIGFVLLALAARLAVAGQGPFPATLDGTVAASGGVQVTLTVTNEGGGEGQTTCRLSDPADRGALHSAFVLSPRIGAGETVTFSALVTEFGTAPRPLTVECREP